MSIEQKVQLVEELYKQLEIEIQTFQSATSLGCRAGCGKCCSNPEIDASPLEFLPYAFHLFLNGKAEEVLEQLKTSTHSICHIYKPLSILEQNNGSCSMYVYRGLICRLFGFAATKDKYGALRLATCKIIKEDQNENFNKAEENISSGLNIPKFTDYYMQLSQIDYAMGTILLPINKALKMAIEEVLHYYSYRPFPNELLKNA